MKITVSKKTENFTILDNTGIRDERLSWKAKGLHTYLLHLPNDWDVYLNDLKNRSKDGRDSTASAINELIDNGYIERKVKREKGKFASYEYTIYEKPYTGNPKTVNPITEKPTLLSTKDTKLLNKVSTKKQPKPFKPPTLQEIKEYVIEKNLNLDSDYFHTYYTTAEWKDNKGNKIKNWKLKALTWSNRQEAKPAAPKYKQL